MIRRNFIANMCAVIGLSPTLKKPEPKKKELYSWTMVLHDPIRTNLINGRSFRQIGVEIEYFVVENEGDKPRVATPEEVDMVDRKYSQMYPGLHKPQENARFRVKFVDNWKPGMTPHWGHTCTLRSSKL